MFALTVAALTALASHVAAHGYIDQIKVGSTYYQGYNPTTFPYMNPIPQVAGWTINDGSEGFISPSQYATPDIICHTAATPGQAHITVAAGSQVEFLWTPWPDTHLGPVITYLANCNGACESVDKTTLDFVKFDASGLVTPGDPGTWATQNLIAQNNTWTVTIPSSLAPGNYVLRNEIIALHSAGSANGAQNYPQCINFAITGSGTAKPAGTLGESLYHETDPGILFNIYQQNNNYTIPGPALWSGAASKARRFDA